MLKSGCMFVLVLIAIVGPTQAKQPVADLGREAATHPAGVESGALIVSAESDVENAGLRIVNYTNGFGALGSTEHDAQGRILSLTIADSQVKFRIIYEIAGAARSRPVAYTVENLLTGVTQYKIIIPSGDNAKSAGDLSIYPQDWESFAEMISDPFGPIWWDLGLAPVPKECKLDDCKDLCDAGGGSGAALCATMALVPGAGAAAAVVCGGVVLGGVWLCRQQCKISCK